MKTSAKNLIICGIVFLFLASMAFGYEIARKIWGTDYSLRIYPGALSLICAIFMFVLAKKKKKEENLSQK